METINSNNVAPAIGPYSHAVEINGMVYTSGMIPLTPQGDLVSDDVTEQTKQVMENIKNVLKEVDLTYNNIVKTTIFIKNMDDFPKINNVYSTYFSDKIPSRSCVEVSRLPKDVQVEIEVIASK
ncbi:RidA family protein [Aliicoccus persicus]|uniref:2-iminobutanoate/2-iminopropanoate deaminase n=1 Tax=Aliicoccus persicus TaxID=930138 RepID=A0A662Z433_9STAP|nr:RidA family protein [Aliicoccus persicus]SEW05867.1 2-iminobutanoate/2-iminopropanoate deaminase [Aliicoccus persicus]